MHAERLHAQKKLEAIVGPGVLEKVESDRMQDRASENGADREFMESQYAGDETRGTAQRTKNSISPSTLHKVGYRRSPSGHLLRFSYSGVHLHHFAIRPDGPWQKTQFTIFYGCKVFEDFIHIGGSCAFQKRVSHRQ